MGLFLNPRLENPNMDELCLRPMVSGHLRDSFVEIFSMDEPEVFQYVVHWQLWRETRRSAWYGMSTVVAF